MAHVSAPGPAGVPLLGSLPDVRRKGLLQFYLDTWQRYGDIVRLQMGPVTQHLVIRPEHIRHVLLENRENYWKGIGMRKVQLALGKGLFTNEGESWRRQRRMMQPAFTPKAVMSFFEAISGSVEQVLAGWARAQAPIEVNAAMMRLAMGAISRAMFQLDVDRDAFDAAGAFTYVLEFASRRSISLVDVPLFVPTAANRRYKQSMDVLQRFIGGIIDERKRQPNHGNDLLGMMLQARDPVSGEPMDDKQLFDEVLTIFFAGHETTAQALSWTWFLLAQHPEVEVRLHQELDSVLAGRVPTAADIPQLAFTRMVIEEAMRLYPPVWVFVRDAYQDDEIGGYPIPAGSMIVFSQYITHRHPDLWQEPERFDPERFSAARSRGRPRYAYFPFGGGPRICLGIHFALLEAIVAVAMIAQRYRLRLLPGQTIEPKMVGTLRPSGPIRMALEGR